MSQVSQTEAACLLETGTLYRTRVGLLPTQGRADLIFIGLKRGAFSIYFGDAPIYHFDLEGRWQRTFMGPTHFLKSLDTTVRAIDRVREGTNLVLRRRVLEDAEVSELDRQIREIAHRINDEHAAGRLVRQEPPAGKALPLTDDQIHELLTRTASWDDDAWTSHLERCRATYGPLPFLPPDSQNAVVLQATRGEARGTSFGLVHAS